MLRKAADVAGCYLKSAATASVSYSSQGHACMITHTNMSVSVSSNGEQAHFETGLFRLNLEPVTDIRVYSSSQGGRKRMQNSYSRISCKEMLNSWSDNKRSYEQHRHRFRNLRPCCAKLIEFPQPTRLGVLYSSRLKELT